MNRSKYQDQCYLIRTVRKINHNIPLDLPFLEWVLNPRAKILLKMALTDIRTQKLYDRVKKDIANPFDLVSITLTGLNGYLWEPSELGPVVVPLNYPVFKRGKKLEEMGEIVGLEESQLNRILSRVYFDSLERFFIESTAKQLSGMIKRGNPVTLEKAVIETLEGNMREIKRIRTDLIKDAERFLSFWKEKYGEECAVDGVKQYEARVTVEGIERYRRDMRNYRR